MKNSSLKKILVVEDELPLALSLKDKFEAAGFDVAIATDGQKGLEAAKTRKPDLVLIDILLPKLDGISMAKKINELGLGVKIIFLTNLNDSKHISEAISAEATDYLVKADWNINDIVDKVKQKLGLK